jgi:hypothetical protein
MIALSFASVPLLHVGQRVMGFKKSPVEERAWFAHPEQMGGNGISRGDPVEFDVSIPSRRPIGWTELTDGIQIASGVIHGATGTTAQVTVRTDAARTHHWISIWVNGIQVPLKVWVAH